MEFKEEDFQEKFLEKSRFEVLYSKQIEDSIREDFKKIKRLLKDKKVRIKIDKEQRMIKLSTTSKTRDPYIIMSSKDFVTLMCKGVPLNEAERIFNDEISFAIIDIDKITNSKEVFRNRRDRLIGPNGDTLKALKMLTDAYILVKSKNVCVIGSYKNVLKVEQFVLCVMENFHPVHLLKQMMARKEVEESDDKKDMNWKNFIPVVKKKLGKGKKIQKEYNVREGKMFMEEPVRKKDIEMVKRKKEN